MHGDCASLEWRKKEQKQAFWNITNKNNRPTSIMKTSPTLKITCSQRPAGSYSAVCLCTHNKLNRYSWIAWKRLQSTGRSIDWVMVDLEAWRRKMSWAPVWPLCCSARHTFMWFWSNKYLKGRRLVSISTARIRKKLHPGSKDIFSKDRRCDFWINTH